MKMDWSNDVAVCIASGPSLTQGQVNYVYDKCKTIVINNNYQIAPWADVLYGCDKNWWVAHDGAKSFQGDKFSLEDSGYDDVFRLNNSGCTGIDFVWPNVRTGGNSGYQAINLAVHFGCRKIVLIGYDMQHTNGKQHWHGNHPQGMNNADGVKRWVKYYDEAAEILKEKGIEVINCTIKTALTCFGRADLRDVL